ncbi:aspartyl/asparaginyl beta-hydroxylase domain-containing protein [Aquimonas voraii]|uniref:Aspartyl/Asparaginyl beta-hydroxylase n=1 Tax=Aquimonas voraii TaxID=265719 RepID=A0A1G6ZDN1_9GAMM|nr:aspartyl/asparaginyl beta-hydroxylase domain-containing protein [Aquimonas voraii]SDE00393.1 Aspartyl/Asparaginyl beta-hydroxylase [Aquimonas voraii]
MQQNIEALVQAALRAVQHGQVAQAVSLWRQVRQLRPDHPLALHHLGMEALHRGATIEAIELLQQAHRAAPGEPMTLVSLAMALRERADSDGEARALTQALSLDPYCLPALLAKAALIEREAGPRAAASHYRNALQVAPPERAWPPQLRTALAHAKHCVDRASDALSEFLEARLGVAREKLSPSEAERWREAGALLAGRSQPYPSKPNRLLVPRLPAEPFFERAQFAWVSALERRTAEIREELNAVHAEAQAEFQPYVAYEPGTPVNQWKELNHSTRWSSYFLWQHGAPVEDHLRACPRTAEALAEVEMADIGGLCPNAMFSALAPHTHIPPHHGETNARLVVHLPLIVPEHCLYRVGFEQRRWKVGEVLIFDDSIEHEARNDSDELRVVLIFDVWNPLLSLAERDMVREISAALPEFERG